MENIFETLKKYDNDLKRSKEDIKKMNKLIVLAEQLLCDVQTINKGEIIR